MRRTWTFEPNRERAAQQQEDSSVVRFEANTVVVDDSSEDFIVVGFADEQGGKYREALHFQRSHKFDDQDRTLGLDSVYAERNDQSQGGYGGVERVELHSDRVRVMIKGDLTKRMGTAEFEIALGVPAAEIDRLREGMRAVFAGFGSLIEMDSTDASGFVIPSDRHR
jgi:Immunity protein 10